MALFLTLNLDALLEFARDAALRERARFDPFMVIIERRAVGDARLIAAAGAMPAAGALCFAAAVLRVLRHMAPCGRQPAAAPGARPA